MSGFKRSLAGLCAALGLQAAGAADLAAGAPAPAFTLPDQHGRSTALADYRGRWVVVYFYPKDDTPGCTTQACSFRDNLAVLTRLNAQVLGVSLDDSQSHARFAEKYKLPFPLLADTDGHVARLYGSLWSLGPIRYARRHSFLIDPEGRVAKIYRNVNPAENAGQLQNDLRGLQAARQPPNP